jgi:hypothetical protein
MQNDLPIENLSQEQLADRVEQLSLKYIQACQDNFLLFVKTKILEKVSSIKR